MGDPVKLFNFVVILLCLLGCARHSPQANDDTGRATQEVFTLNADGLLVLGEGYVIEVPAADFMVMTSMVRGIAGPKVLVDLTGEKVHIFGPWKETGYTGTFALPPEEASALRQRWSAERFAGIPPHNDKYVRGGRRFLLYANRNGAVFRIRHVDTDHQDLLELRDIYGSLLTGKHAKPQNDP